MIIQINTADGRVISFDSISKLEDVERVSPSYITVVEADKSYLDGLTKAQVKAIADTGPIEYPEGASKPDMVDAIIKYKPEA